MKKKMPCVKDNDFDGEQLQELPRVTHKAKSTKMFGDVFHGSSILQPGGFAFLINFPEVTLWFLKLLFLYFPLNVLAMVRDSNL